MAKYYSSQCVLLVDNGSALGIKIAVEGALAYFDDVFDKRKVRLFIIVMGIQTFKRTDYKQLYELLQLTNDELVSLIKPTSFSDALLEAVSMARGHRPFIMYAVYKSREEGAEEYFKAYQIIRELQSPVQFEILLLNPNEDYTEFLGELHAKDFHICQSTSADDIKSKLRVNTAGNLHCHTLKLYPYLGAPSTFEVVRINVRHAFRRPTKQLVHKTSKKIVKVKKVHKYSYYVGLHMKGCKKSITAEQYKDLRDPGIPIGITLRYAVKICEGDLIKLASLKPVVLLRPKSGPYYSKFVQMWEAFKDLRVVCFVRITRMGTVHQGEMMSILVDGKPHFRITIIPSADQIHDSPAYEEDWEEADKPRLFSDLFDKLIEEAIIPDFQLKHKNLCPLIRAKRREYLKSQMLRGYQPKMIPHPNRIPWHEGDPGKIKEIVDELNASSARYSTKRGRKGKK